MECIFGDGQAALIRQSDKGNMIGLCSKHAHITVEQINQLLYRKVERNFCKALLFGL